MCVFDRCLVVAGLCWLSSNSCTTNSRFRRFVFQIFIGNQQLLMGNISLENKSLVISTTLHCRLSRPRWLRMVPGIAWPQPISRSVVKVLEAEGNVCQLIEDNFLLVIRRSGWHPGPLLLLMGPNPVWPMAYPGEIIHYYDTYYYLLLLESL